MKISDIKHIHHADYKPDKPKKKGKGQKEEPKRSRKQSPPHMFGGMSPMAHDTFMEQKKDMTSFEIGVSDTKIIIPSFKTTSKLFAQHFQILRELNHKLQLLKKSKDKQRSEDQSWYQIDEIISVLDSGIKFLNFPDIELASHMVEDTRLHDSSMAD